jgi:hypothetical protein
LSLFTGPDFMEDWLFSVTTFPRTLLLTCLFLLSGESVLLSAEDVGLDLLMFLLEGTAAGFVLPGWLGDTTPWEPFSTPADLNDDIDWDLELTEFLLPDLSWSDEDSLLRSEPEPPFNTDFLNDLMVDVAEEEAYSDDVAVEPLDTVLSSTI